MRDCLVMLTKTFPFDKGEEFIENELPVLAEKFEHVFLIATSTADNAVQTRQVPQNVTVYHIPASQVKRYLPGAAARLLFSPSMHGFIERDELKQAHAKLKSWAFFYYFIAKSEVLFSICRRILLAHRMKAYDGITFYAYWFYDVAVVANQLKKYCPAQTSKAVCRAHGYDLYQERQPSGFLPLRPYLLKNLDAVYPCSENGTRYILQHWPAGKGKVHTAYLGTRDYGLGPVPREDCFHIVSCCHISPVKRVELLAQALSLLQGSGLKLKWTHIGDGDTLKELRNFAKEHLAFMETDLRGALPNQQLMSFYQSTPVSLFVNTSSSEGLPVSIMEASSFGIPSIATDVGGTSELIRTGETGQLLPADLTPEALAKAIRDAASQSAEKMAAQRKACRAVWEQSFQADKNFAAFAENILPF
ncbi:MULTISPECIES: glycosyltransferase [Caproicibacterium]|uniref:Glycosyltransferase n=1 Tax=Caproicibacterium lactatifermentans TaxID=2666138 RepID=A0A859DQA0_9FIRM|nr:glycosyltransferase [Caproicibacterium lactatifermentans]ARP50249.1 glycosyl transferase family 1 [Ruminococcaceae bacterium CPB6]MDD4808157.1 glycosyltransferase [Oscillospiraceae bacterium]QKN24028.1 glycosyltransferase [Caproicibacterium lactatifermentans]QKO30900.1 glycosyltransferase [Caproicibacterium lactatifermentans]